MTSFDFAGLVAMGGELSKELSCDRVGIGVSVGRWLAWVRCARGVDVGMLLVEGEASEVASRSEAASRVPICSEAASMVEVCSERLWRG